MTIDVTRATTDAVRTRAIGSASQGARRVVSSAEPPFDEVLTNEGDTESRALAAKGPRTRSRDGARSQVRERSAPSGPAFTGPADGGPKTTDRGQARHTSTAELEQDAPTSRDGLAEHADADAPGAVDLAATSLAVSAAAAAPPVEASRHDGDLAGTDLAATDLAATDLAAADLAAADLAAADLAATDLAATDLAATDLIAGTAEHARRGVETAPFVPTNDSARRGGARGLAGAEAPPSPWDVARGAPTFEGSGEARFAPRHEDSAVPSHLGAAPANRDVSTHGAPLPAALEDAFEDAGSHARNDDRDRLDGHATPRERFARDATFLDPRARIALSLVSALPGPKGASLVSGPSRETGPSTASDTGEQDRSTIGETSNDDPPDARGETEETVAAARLRHAVADRGGAGRAPAGDTPPREEEPPEGSQVQGAARAPSQGETTSAPRSALPSGSSPPPMGSHFPPPRQVERGAARTAAAEGLARELEVLVRERRQEAATSAVNRMTLRQAAEGRIDLGELGKVTVSASTHLGEVDVTIRAEQDDTLALLHSASGLIEGELRREAVDVRHLGIERDGRRDPREDTPRRQDRRDDRHEHEAPRDAAPGFEGELEQTVRFVLSGTDAP